MSIHQRQLSAAVSVSCSVKNDPSICNLSLPVVDASAQLGEALSMLPL